jgi:signal transduction histidine kinase
VTRVTTAAHATFSFRETLRRRVREPEFWTIQVGVLTISLAHIMVEAGGISLGPVSAHDTAAHILVILYMAPVAYAGLTYGWEGGVLTGLAAGVLASVNIVLFSLSDFDWALESLLVVVVISMGVLTAREVERERSQRRIAETAASRMEALNQLARAAVPARTARAAANAIVRELVDQLEVGSAGLVLWRSQDHQRVVSSVHGPDPAVTVAIEQLESPASTPVSANVLDVSFASELLIGRLILPAGTRTGDEPDASAFLSAVGNQIAVRIENAILLEQEQTVLATYARLVTQAQEEERRRLARELHDGPAQQLAILVRDLGGSTDGAGPLHEAAADVLRDLRRLARDQRPTLLDDLGMVAALEWLIGESDLDPSRRVSLSVDGAVTRLDPAVEVVCYRIAQEALRNAQRHANATEISVHIAFDGDAVKLSIRDDGTGFEALRTPGDHLPSGRLGLMGMHERAQLVGGRLEIVSGSAGTAVTLEVPGIQQPTSE